MPSQYGCREPSHTLLPLLHATVSAGMVRFVASTTTVAADSEEEEKKLIILREFSLPRMSLYIRDNYLIQMSFLNV